MLPFNAKATLTEQNGDVVAQNVPVSIWPSGRLTAGAASDYQDFEGIASKAYKGELRPNRRLLLGGERYSIIEATPAFFSPWVSMRVRRMGAV